MACQKPNCLRDSSETYTGKHGNELDLCEKHYYKLVSGKKASERLTGPIGVGTDPVIRGVEGANTDLRDSLGTSNEYIDTDIDDVQLLSR